MVHAEQEVQFLAIAQPQPQNVCKNDDYRLQEQQEHDQCSLCY